MKYKSLTLLLFLIQSLVTIAQPSIAWQRCLGGTGFESPAFSHSYKDVFQQTSDNGFVFACTSTSNDGDVTGHHGSVFSEDYWIVKADSIGNIQWQKSLGGTQTDIANSIQQTYDGGYIVGGFVWSTDGNVTGNHGDTDYWIVKLDNAGNIQWQKCLGGSGYDQAYSIKQTLDSGFVVAGRSNSGNGDVTGLHVASGYSSDYWIAKLNSSGNIQWQRCLGGFGEEEAHSIILSNDGGFVVVGETRSNNGDVTGNHDTTGNYYDYWVVKLNSFGNIQWQKCYGGSMNDSPNSISSTSDGGYIMAGQTSSNDGDVTGYLAQYGEGWVVKIDSIGNIQWQKCFGGTASTAVQTLDGGFLISGTVAPNDSDATLFPWIENYWLVKIDSAGNFQWHSCDGPKNGGYCNSAVQTTDGRFAFLGTVYNNGGDVSGAHGGQDVWLVKLSNINIEKSKQREICSQCNGSVMIKASGGTPTYSYLWNSGATTDTISNLCHGTFAVTVTDASGQTGFCSEVIFNDTVTVYGNQLPASCWSCPDGSATLHPSGGSGVYHYSWLGFPDTTATLSGLPHGFVYGCVTDSMGCIACDSIDVLSPVGIEEIYSPTNLIKIFPNPTSGEINLKISKQFGQPNIVNIYSSMGELIVTVENSSIIDLANCKAGIYLVLVTNGRGEILRTIVLKV